MIKMDCAGVYTSGEPNCYRFPKRPSWDEFFMQQALGLAKRSTCIRRKIGAVMAVGKRVVAQGYNGTVSGDSHCLDIGCLKDQHNIPSGQRQEFCRAVHAEQNLFLQLAEHGVAVRLSDNPKVYCTTFPCHVCAKMLVGIGVKEIYYIEGYPDELSQQLFDRMKVRTYKMS